MEDNEQTIAEAIHAAISEVYRTRGGLVSRWTMTVEAVHEGGVRTMAYLTSPDMQIWEVIGMTEAASEYARTQLQLEYIDDSYSDPDDGEDEEEAEIG